ncbi:MAG TPA: hypothetical protein VFD84_19315 [Candidatus Binatia bacterium]|jgi:hypothetical protein|nr:hypothetical protein [Candidatus Binatia bacterium]
MTDCEEVTTALALGAPLDAGARAHLAACARCGADEVRAREIARTLAAYAVPAPPPGLAGRVAAAAGPLLARTRHVRAPRLARTIAAALVPLPAIVVWNVVVLRAAARLLDAVLPPALGAYLVFSYATLLALLLAASYAAIPLLAERQRRRREESHA